MDIAAILMEMYPDADHITGYRISNGQIVEWNLPEPQPTQATMEAVWKDMAARRKKGEFTRRYIYEACILFPEAEDESGNIHYDACTLYITTLVLKGSKDTRIPQVSALADKMIRGNTEVDRLHARSNTAGGDILALTWEAM